MAHLSSRGSSKPQSPQKAYLLGELANTKKTLAQKEEQMRQLVERLQRLEATQERQTRERRWESRKAFRSYTHYGSQEEDQDWRVHNFEERRHQHPPPKPYFPFPFVNLPSFSGDSDPNVYLGCEAKIEQIFNVYEVEDDQKVKIASIEFVDYAMQWWHQVLKDIGLNKRPIMISWYDLKECISARFAPYYRKELLLKLQPLHQGPRSVDEYFKDSEITLTKINMHETEESKIARFVSELRKAIQNVVEHYEYTSFEQMVHLAIKVESQLLKKTTFKHTHNDGFYDSSWKGENKFSKQDNPSKESVPAG